MMPVLRLFHNILVLLNTLMVTKFVFVVKMVH